MESPLASRSTHGEMHAPPAGSGVFASRSATSVATVSPPPAESPRSRCATARRPPREASGTQRWNPPRPRGRDAPARAGSRGRGRVRAPARERLPAIPRCVSIEPST
jgi:hypothetical protein